MSFPKLPTSQSAYITSSLIATMSTKLAEEGNDTNALIMGVQALLLAIHAELILAREERHAAAAQTNRVMQ